MYFEEVEESGSEEVRNQRRQLRFAQSGTVVEDRRWQSQMFTWTECVCVQHASLPVALQLLYLHLAPGDVGDASLHVPELLMGRLYTLVQGPRNLHTNTIFYLN